MMPRFKIKIKRFGAKALLIEWPNRIDGTILDDIIRFTASVLENEKTELINHTPGYNSLVLQYDLKIDFNKKKRLLEDMYNSQKEETIYATKTWHIPVC